MKRSQTFLLAVAIGAALISAASYAVGIVMEARNWAVARFDACVLHVAQVFSEPTLQAPHVKHVQARSFVARLLKRERPTIESSWRMCPST